VVTCWPNFLKESEIPEDWLCAAWPFSGTWYVCRQHKGRANAYKTCSSSWKRAAVAEFLWTVACAKYRSKTCAGYFALHCTFRTSVLSHLKAPLLGESPLPSTNSLVSNHSTSTSGSIELEIK
jgi:hypothetical protein